MTNHRHFRHAVHAVHSIENNSRSPHYHVIGGDGHPKDLDLHPPGLRDSIADSPARLLVTIKRVAVCYHNHVFVPLEGGAKQWM